MLAHFNLYAKEPYCVESYQNYICPLTGECLQAEGKWAQVYMECIDAATFWKVSRVYLA